MLHLHSEVTFTEHLLGAGNFCMVSCFRGTVVHWAIVNWLEL